MAIRQTIAKRFVTGTTTDTAAFAAATLAGSTILIAVDMYNGVQSLGAAFGDDSAGSVNGYTVVASGNNVPAEVVFGYCQNAAACQNIDLTSGETMDGFWQAFEIDNAPASSLDGTPNFYYDADSNPNASVGLTTTQDGSIIFVMCGTRENFGTYTLGNPSTGYTSDHLDTTQSGAQISSSLAHKTASAGAQTADWTHGTGSPGAAGMIAFKQNATGALLVNRFGGGLQSLSGNLVG